MSRLRTRKGGFSFFFPPPSLDARRLFVSIPSRILQDAILTRVQEQALFINSRSEDRQSEVSGIEAVQERRRTRTNRNYQEMPLGNLVVLYIPSRDSRPRLCDTACPKRNRNQCEPAWNSFRDAMFSSSSTFRTLRGRAQDTLQVVAVKETE